MSETYFVARDEQQIGPFTKEELLRAIREGRYQPDDLLWQDSVGDWKPLGEVVPFKHQFGSDEAIEPDQWAPAPPPPPPVASPVPLPGAAPLGAPARSGDLIRPGDNGSLLLQRRPFVRYAARMIDMGIFFFIMIPLAQGLGINFDAERLFLVEIILLAMMVPVEALVMAQFGTTPGKAFMRVRVVRADGQRLDLSTSVSRATKLWLTGWGLGLPLISVVTLILSFARLMGEGKTVWDSQCGTQVLHEPIGFGRGLLAVFLIFFLMGSSLGGLVEQAMRVSQ